MGLSLPVGRGTDKLERVPQVTVCRRPGHSRWVLEKRYKFVGRLFPFRAAELVAVHALLRTERMAMVMMASKAKRTKALKAAQLHGDLL